MAVAYVLLGLAPGMTVIALAVVVWGLAASVYHPTGLSLISKGVEKRGAGLAYRGIPGNLGIGLGPLLVAVLFLFVDWRTVALALSVPVLLAAAYASRAKFAESAAVETTTTTDVGKARTSDSLSELLSESRRLFAGQFVLVFVVVSTTAVSSRSCRSS